MRPGAMTDLQRAEQKLKDACQEVRNLQTSEAGMSVYGLRATGFEGLIAKTGKFYGFAGATIAANSPDEARRLALDHDTYGLEWGDEKKFSCSPMRVYGAMPSSSYVAYQVTPEE